MTICTQLVQVTDSDKPVCSVERLLNEYILIHRIRKRGLHTLDFRTYRPKAIKYNQARDDLRCLRCTSSIFVWLPHALDFRLFHYLFTRLVFSFSLFSFPFSYTWLLVNAQIDCLYHLPNSRLIQWLNKLDDKCRIFHFKSQIVVGQNRFGEF